MSHHVLPLVAELAIPGAPAKKETKMSEQPWWKFPRIGSYFLDRLRRLIKQNTEANHILAHCAHSLAVMLLHDMIFCVSIHLIFVFAFLEKRANVILPYEDTYFPGYDYLEDVVACHILSTEEENAREIKTCRYILDKTT